MAEQGESIILNLKTYMEGLRHEGAQITPDHEKKATDAGVAAAENPGTITKAAQGVEAALDTQKANPDQS